MIESEAKYPFGGNVYYVTMQITLFTRKFRNVQCNLHCDVVHITTKWVFRLTLDCSGVLAIKGYTILITCSALYVCIVFSMDPLRSEIKLYYIIIITNPTTSTLFRHFDLFVCLRIMEQYVCVYVRVCVRACVRV